MKHLQVAYSLGMICLVGATIQIIYGLLSIPFPFYDPDASYGWDEALWAVANIGMIGGALGLLALNVARPRWLALVGAALSVLGNLVRIVASVLLITTPTAADAYVSLILISVLLMTVGMTTLGVSILLGKHLRRWQAWVPLLAGLCPLVILPTYGINLPLHFLLLGFWGIPWLLVGSLILSVATMQRNVTPGKVSAVVR